MGRWECSSTGSIPDLQSMEGLSGTTVSVFEKNIKGNKAESQQLKQQSIFKSRCVVQALGQILHKPQHSVGLLGVFDCGHLAVSQLKIFDQTLD